MPLMKQNHFDFLEKSRQAIMFEIKMGNMIHPELLQYKGYFLISILFFIIHENGQDTFIE